MSSYDRNCKSYYYRNRDRILEERKANYQTLYKEYSKNYFKKYYEDNRATIINRVREYNKNGRKKKPTIHEILMSLSEKIEKPKIKKVLKSDVIKINIKEIKTVNHILDLTDI